MAEEKTEKKKPISSRWRVADELEANGGLVLLGAGVALIVLACLFAQQATVAPIFAGFGAVMLILGAFYPRIEGNVEASREGLRTTVQALRRRAREEELPADVADEALDRALAQTSTLNWDRWLTAHLAESRAERAIGEAQSEHEAILAALERWLAGNGYHVKREVGGVDLIGKGAAGVAMVETSVSRSIDVATVHRLTLFNPPRGTARPAKVRRILAFPAASKVTKAAGAAAQQLEIELVSVDRDGQVDEWEDWV
jgi:hypothetical protein